MFTPEDRGGATFTLVRMRLLKKVAERERGAMSTGHHVRQQA